MVLVYEMCGNEAAYGPLVAKQQRRRLAEEAKRRRRGTGTALSLGDAWHRLAIDGRWKLVVAGAGFASAVFFAGVRVGSVETLRTTLRVLTPGMASAPSLTTK